MSNPLTLHPPPTTQTTTAAVDNDNNSTAVDNENNCVAVDKLAANHEAAVTADKPAARVGPIAPPASVCQEFRVGVNVNNAEWSRGKWCLGQVTEFDNRRYTVYFLFGKQGEVKPAAVTTS